jgi:hypothetical protein
VDGFDLVAGFLQALAHFVGHHYAAVLAAGAAKGYGQIALALVHVVRQTWAARLRFRTLER